MKTMKRINKFQRLDSLKSIGVFWLVMLILDIVGYILLREYGSSFYGVSSGVNGVMLKSVVTANIMSILIFFIVYPYEIYYKYFPIALSFSVTRKDFYKSIIIDNLIVAFIFALVQSVLMKLDMHVIRGLGKNPMVDMGIFNVSEDNIMYIIALLFLFFMAFISIINLLSSLNYKFGFKLWIVLGVVLALPSIVLGVPFLSMFNKFVTLRLDVMQLIVLCIINILLYIIGYFVVTYTNIKK